LGGGVPTRIRRAGEFQDLRQPQLAAFQHGTDQRLEPGYVVVEKADQSCDGTADGRVFLDPPGKTTRGFCVNRTCVIQ